MLGKYVFSSKNGFCPNCIAHGKIWFIQDKSIGNNYEYCLMSKSVRKPIELKFKNKNDVARWLNDDTGKYKYDDTTSDFIISRQIKHGYDFYDKAIVERYNKNYIYDRVKNKITELIEPSRETGWFENYHECLRMAKDILKRLEYEQYELELNS